MGSFWSEIGFFKLLVMSAFAIFAGTFSIVRFYILAISEAHGEKAKDYYKYIPVAIGLGTGIAVNNTKAVIEAIVGKVTEFKRTPKYAVVSKEDSWKSTSYLLSSNEVTTVIEVCFAVIFTFLNIIAIYKGYVGWIPFLLLIQFGFIYTSFLSIYHSSRKA